MRPALIIEVAHLIVAVAVVFLVFWGFAWSYPPGAATIWAVGGVTVAIAVLLQVPPILHAGRRG